jgi:hypothetical protein
MSGARYLGRNNIATAQAVVPSVFSADLGSIILLKSFQGMDVKIPINANIKICLWSFLEGFNLLHLQKRYQQK